MHPLEITLRDALLAGIIAFATAIGTSFVTGAPLDRAAMVAAALLGLRVVVGKIANTQAAKK